MMMIIKKSDYFSILDLYGVGDKKDNLLGGFYNDLNYYIVFYKMKRLHSKTKLYYICG